MRSKIFGASVGGVVVAREVDARVTSTAQPSSASEPADVQRSCRTDARLQSHASARPTPNDNAIVASGCIVVHKSKSDQAANAQMIVSRARLKGMTMSPSSTRSMRYAIGAIHAKSRVVQVKRLKTRRLISLWATCTTETARAHATTSHQKRAVVELVELCVTKESPRGSSRPT